MTKLTPLLALALVATSTLASDFRIRSQVLTVSEGKARQLYLFDGKEFTHLWDRSDAQPPCQCGDIVDVDGIFDPDSTVFPHRVATRIRRVRSEPLPETPVVDLRQLISSKIGRSPIAMRGVLISAVRDAMDSQWNWLTLSTPEGKVAAAATENEYPLQTLLKLVDAEVLLRGMGNPTMSWRNPNAPSPILFGKDGIRVEREPPTNPFDDSPDFAGAGILHRQRIRGTVIGTGSDRVFITMRSGTFAALLCMEGQPRPNVGAQVTAVGFNVPTPGGTLLAQALVREDPLPPADPAHPLRIDSRRLFTDDSGHRLANTRFIGKVITLRGTVEDSADTISQAHAARVNVGSGMVSIDLSNLRDARPKDFGYGYEIEVSGVCYAQFEHPIPDSFPRFSGFTLYPRDPDDLVILRRPPWWTPLRLVTVIGFLLAALVAILIWNRTLHRLSERRGRELAREQLRHATSELKVEERTRLAVELHDSISQTLTGVALQIDAAQGSSESPAVAGRFLDTARAMLASCRQELRCCIWDLKSRTFDENDMTEAVTRTLAPHLGDVETQVRFNVPRSILSESATHGILRIVRELTVNAIRHGRARHLRIAGELRDGLVRFSVRDDGTGFDPQDVPGPAQGHFGLQGIRERISGRNGDMTVESSPGKGTKVTVAFAADERDEDEP